MRARRRIKRRVTLNPVQLGRLVAPRLQRLADAVAYVVRQNGKIGYREILKGVFSQPNIRLARVPGGSTAEAPSSGREQGGRGA